MRTNRLPWLLLPLIVGCGATAANETGDDAETVAESLRQPQTLSVSRVLLLSIDGMHAQDLEKFMAAHPSSALTQLARRGVRYKNAWVNRLDDGPTNPTDSFPGLLALTTGGSSPTTGGWYDVSYARDLYPDATCTTKGTAVAYDEGAELDNTHLWGSATDDTPTHLPQVVRSRLDPAKLPYRRTPTGCSPVLPHDYLRTNTIFEVAHEASLRTAWSDKHLAYELVTGPSGAGLDDFFAPEINSLASNLLGSTAAEGADFTKDFRYTEAYDDFKVRAILNQIDGRYSDDGLPGATDAVGAPGVPALFGMNFQAVSVAQKDAKSGLGGYLSADATPNVGTADALAHTDASIGRIVDALRTRDLLASTLIVVTAKHGQSPIDPSLVQKKDGDAIASLVDAAAPVAGHIEDDVALYWLKDSSQAKAGAAALIAATGTGGPTDPAADQVLTVDSEGYVARFGDPAIDPRTPDIVVSPKKGTIYSLSAKKLAEHGGFADDDAHVALLVSNPALSRTIVTSLVRTKQVAPTILDALGLDHTRLTAVQKEGTRSLPYVQFTGAITAPPVRWTAAASPVPATITNGPWTLTQLAEGTPVPPPPGSTLTNVSFGYCDGGVRRSNVGTVPMQPYYFPAVSGQGLELQGFFDYRPKDLDESIVAAKSHDGGKSWIFQQEAFNLTSACPVDVTHTNPDAAQADNGYGHPYVFDAAGKTHLYVVDRSDASLDKLGLVVTELTNSRTTLERTLPDLPLDPAPASIPSDASALVRTRGLLNPDGILGVVPDTSPVQVLYVAKIKGGDNTGSTALPPEQQCDAQPYIQPGQTKPRKANHDLVTIRRASTVNGIDFLDLGPVAGLNDSTTTSYLGTRYVAPNGTLLKLRDGRYGLFFAGGNCLDADSDAFHFIGYAESNDLEHWTVLNGVSNPIASVAPVVVSVSGQPTTIPAQLPVVGSTLGWFQSRVYAPSVARLDSRNISLTFAGYGVQSPNSDLLHYRQIGNVVLTASEPIPRLP